MGHFSYIIRSILSECTHSHIPPNQLSIEDCFLGILSEVKLAVSAHVDNEPFVMVHYNTEHQRITVKPSLRAR